MFAYTVPQKATHPASGQMRTLIDNMRNTVRSAVVVLGSLQDSKAALIVNVTADLTSWRASREDRQANRGKVGGSGGGHPDMAEARGKDPTQLDAGLNEAYAAVEGLVK